MKLTWFLSKFLLKFSENTASISAMQGLLPLGPTTGQQSDMLIQMGYSMSGMKKNITLLLNKTIFECCNFLN